MRMCSTNAVIGKQEYSLGKYNEWSEIGKSSGCKLLCKFCIRENDDVRQRQESRDRTQIPITIGTDATDLHGFFDAS